MLDHVGTCKVCGEDIIVDQRYDAEPHETAGYCSEECEDEDRKEQEAEARAGHPSLSNAERNSGNGLTG